jgi:hypothetical protein
VYDDPGGATYPGARQPAAGARQPAGGAAHPGSVASNGGGAAPVYDDPTGATYPGARPVASLGAGGSAANLYNDPSGATYPGPQPAGGTAAAGGGSYPGYPAGGATVAGTPAAGPQYDDYDGYYNREGYQQLELDDMDEGLTAPTGILDEENRVAKAKLETVDSELADLLAEADPTGSVGAVYNDSAGAKYPGPSAGGGASPPPRASSGAEEPPSIASAVGRPDARPAVMPDRPATVSEEVVRSAPTFDGYNDDEGAAYPGPRPTSAAMYDDPSGAKYPGPRPTAAAVYDDPSGATYPGPRSSGSIGGPSARSSGSIGGSSVAASSGGGSSSAASASSAGGSSSSSASASAGGSSSSPASASASRGSGGGGAIVASAGSARAIGSTGGVAAGGVAKSGAPAAAPARSESPSSSSGGLVASSSGSRSASPGGSSAAVPPPTKAGAVAMAVQGKAPPPVYDDPSGARYPGPAASGTSPSVAAAGGGAGVVGPDDGLAVADEAEEDWEEEREGGRYGTNYESMASRRGTTGTSGKRQRDVKWERARVGGEATDRKRAARGSRGGSAAARATAGELTSYDDAETYNMAELEETTVVAIRPDNANKLDVAEVNANTKTSSSKTNYCLEKARRERPGTKGVVDIGFTVVAGRVTSAKIERNTTGSDYLGKCVADMVGRWKFDEKAQDKAVKTFHFR